MVKTIRTIGADYPLRTWIFILSLAAITGVGGGVGAVIFRYMIDFFQWIFFDITLPYTSILTFGGYNFGIVLLPVICGLIIGPIIFGLSPETKGHGVPEVMYSVHLAGGKIRKRVAGIKILVSAATLGSGGSAGREGPVAQIGGSIGSSIGQFLRLGEENMRLLATCGVAAGIAGTFNAPLGGAFFGMEIIMRKYKFKYMIPILVSGAVGAWTTAAIVGTRPAFQTTMSNLTFQSTDLIFFAILGIGFGVFSFIWVRVFYYIEDVFDNMKIPNILKPALGMSAAGIIGMILAHHYMVNLNMDFVPKYYGIMGVGYTGMDLALMGELSLGMLLLLGALKIIATSLTIGSGGSGGIFAPSLYIGTMFGLASGYILQSLFPTLISDPNIYAVGGMAALFAGAARAPLTVIFQVPEMTRSFELFLPLMVMCGLSYMVSSILFKGSSIYTIKLERRGEKIIESDL